MLSYDNLYNAPVDQLKSAVDEWTEMIGKLQPLGGELRDSVRGPLSGWTGKDAKAATEFIDKTGKEFEDAVKEATGIRDILSEAHDRFRTQRDELHRIAGQDAPAQGLQVDSAGKVTLKQEVREDDQSTWRGKGSFDEAVADAKQAIAVMAKRIERARANATEADDTAAWALHVNLGGQQHNFVAPKHTTLAQAWQAGSENNFADAQNYIFNEMIKNMNSKDIAEMREKWDSWNPIEKAQAIKEWYDKVKSNGPWDHKPILEDRYGMETKNEYDLKVPGQNKKVSYDIWSNIHYGYVGRSAGFPSELLERAATMDIPGVGRTDEGDKMTVRLGIELYEKYGPNLTKEQFQQEVDRTIQEMERKKAPQVKSW
ncbi:polymorphic toxin type 44 domain-containing protein [Goodfellowiella coeruleoviolacea]|uniref:Toxin 44 n=1 Tax=Goodfellowiella coeruleoviolacea TaxID=334858 RepID=A0AAE3GLA3_9PSEU|nr:polymorphic toxin type 44 domain-containing protein [Goodfellowiella coeruleoviolacea]MCP2169713.1 toxin 44 [Goodfellowiella coeruleoviolacea]